MAIQLIVDLLIIEEYYYAQILTKCHATFFFQCYLDT
jgi:hypothetical protein